MSDKPSNLTDAAVTGHMPSDVAGTFTVALARSIRSNDARRAGRLFEERPAPLTLAIRQPKPYGDAPLLEAACRVAHRAYGFARSTLILFPEADRARLPELARVLSDGAHVNREVRVFDDTPRPRMATVMVATTAALADLTRDDEAGRRGDEFQVIIAAPGFAETAEAARALLTESFRLASVHLVWTDEPPAVEEGFVSISDITPGGDTPSPRRAAEDVLVLKLNPVASAGLLGGATAAQTLSLLLQSDDDDRDEDTSYEHPFKSLPPARELKVATVASVINEQDGETVRPGMYVLVPEHFPTSVKVFRGTAGYYARVLGEAVQGDARIADNFLVRPAPSVARATELYGELLEGEPLPDFLICVRHTPPPARGLYSVPPGILLSETLVCCCGAATTLRYTAGAERYLPDNRAWVQRTEGSPDIHLPHTWYCGKAGHYLRTAISHRNYVSRDGRPADTMLLTELMREED